MVNSEHTHLYFGEPLLSQVFGDAPHIVDSPDAIPVAGRHPCPQTPGPYRPRRNVPVQNRQIREHCLVSRQIRRGTASDGKPYGEDTREIDMNAPS